jgi:hypothetical protein
MKKNRKTGIEKLKLFFKKNLNNRNILVFLFFLALSAFLWFLNAINKEYTTTVKIPYKLENIPNNLILKNNEANELNINISGHGYSLLKTKIERIKLPLIIDFDDKLNTISIYKNLKDNKESYILTNELYSSISHRFSDNIRITSIKPDTIYFYIKESLNSKKVPIISNVEYELHPEFLLIAPPRLSEDSVIIFGQKRIIDSIENVYTKKINIGIINESNKRTLELQMQPDVKYSMQNVKVEFPVEKYTETYKEVTILPLNFQENANIILSPGTVEVFYKVPLSMYNNIDKDNFDVSVNYDKRKNDIIPVDVKSLSNVIEITRINPIYVKYILEKNNLND